MVSMMTDRRLVLKWMGASTLAVAAIAAPVAVTPALALSAGDLLVPQALPDMQLGSDDAPVTIVEYASMTCPHCAHFHETTLPGLKEKYIDTGKARLIFREFPFDPRAAAAFMLARCAPKEQYFPLIDVMFKQQDVWATAQDPRPPLLQIVKLAGFTQESFEACLKNQQVLDNVMAVREKATKDYKVDSTPTFFINGEKVSGALSVEDMSKYIDKHL
ncbi:MAG: DsbA family protein [Nitratireductor sp.]|nr:DsbA family protein [Nitratireductor sp.]